MTSNRVALRVVGFGFIRLPGERKRWARAEAEARRLLDLAEAAAPTEGIEALRPDYGHFCAADCDCKPPAERES